MSNSTFKRRKKFISPLQLRVTAAFLAVAALATLFQVLVLNNAITDLAREVPDHGEALLSALPSLLAKNIMMTLGLMAPVMVTVGILVTHRVAGPAYRMEQYLREVAREGRVAGPCRTREGDEFSGLVEALNDALAKISSEARDSRDEQSAPEQRSLAA